MARTQDLLIRAPKGSVDMADLLRLELQAHGGRQGGNFHLDGPAVALPQSAVQNFVMAIHELTTNAVKHGAFASDEGRVEISWKLHADEGDETRVLFRWRERCPKMDASASRAGYGSRVLDAAFRYTLKGSSQLTLHPDGAEFVADFVLS